MCAKQEIPLKKIEQTTVIGNRYRLNDSEKTPLNKQA